jgi:hypothetical protein
VVKAVEAGELRVDDELHLTPLAAEEEEPELVKFRAALDHRIGEAQLQELLSINFPAGSPQKIPLRDNSIRQWIPFDISIFLNILAPLYSDHKRFSTASLESTAYEDK